MRITGFLHHLHFGVSALEYSIGSGYCEICGKITLFYKNKLLKSYEDYIIEMNAEYALAAAAAMAEQESEEKSLPCDSEPDFDPLDFS